MPRPKKDYRVLNAKLDKTISDRLEKYCELEGRTKTTSVERILKEYLDDYDSSHDNATQKDSTVKH